MLQRVVAACHKEAVDLTLMWGDAAPFSPWVYLLEHHPDVRVSEVELPAGLQGCVDHQERVVWLDSRLSPVARRCTLTFELGQLEHGPTPSDPCLAAAHRRAAEDWAARMLIPLAELLIGFSQASHLPEIAEHLAVDTPMLRARCRGLTDDEQDAVMDAIRGMRAVA